MKKYVFLFVTALLMAGISYGQVESGDANKGKTRGDDPNIKVEKRLNDKDAESKAVQPTEKGARARGAGYCYVEFDNYTDWYIDCYVDGYYEGYMAPWGDGTVTVRSGTTCLYAVAEFTDGSKVSWGPSCKACSYDEFEMEVYEDYYNIYVRRD